MKTRKITALAAALILALSAASCGNSGDASAPYINQPAAAAQAADIEPAANKTSFEKSDSKVSDAFRKSAADFSAELLKKSALGDIKAGTGSYATWDLTSSLLGHFVDYDVRVNHVTSYGNPDLSLLDEVTIHELIHSVNVRFGDQHYRGWVCNDVEDGHAEPDHIYLNNGTDEALKTLSGITSVVSIIILSRNLLSTSK